MARRRTEVFTLSFLDCICCGFGAVVLFYTIISANSGAVRIIKNNDLTGEVSKLEEEVRVGTKNLVVLRNSLDKTRSETASAMSRANILLAELQRRQQETSVYSADSMARREHINKLKADVKALDESTRRLEAQVQDSPVPTPGLSAGRSLTPRRYITGLKLKGKRILVLIDHSASMLDEDLVEIIKLRNSSDAKSGVGIRDGVIAWMFPSERLIEGGCYPGKEALDSPSANEQWDAFVEGDNERVEREGMLPDWFQLFGKEEELAEIYVAEHYLPIRIMDTLVVLITVEGVQYTICKSARLLAILQLETRSVTAL